MGTERIPIMSMPGWMREQERNQQRQERRHTITSASDILGPGFGPTSTLVQDWNDAQTTFNGFFYSVEGLSINSPDSALAWAGLVIAEADNESGIQEVWSSHAGTPPRRYTRRWSTSGGGVVFTDWIGDSEWQTSGITALPAATLLTQTWRTQGRLVSLVLDLVLIGAMTSDAQGNVPNTAVATVPAGIAPVNCPRPEGQALATGSAGPMCGWSISSTGTVVLCTTFPSFTIPAGAHLSVGGTYSL